MSANLNQRRCHMAVAVLQCPECEDKWGCKQFEAVQGSNEEQLKGLTPCKDPCELLARIGKCPKANGSKIEKMRCEPCLRSLN